MQSPCNPITEDYIRDILHIQEEDVLSVQCGVSFRWSRTDREVDGLSLIFNDFNVPALTQHLNRDQPAL
jgi:hypothetical protein